ncbi:BREX-1 system adenine-specific DNA-methyltransferase PglX [Clostridium botulinum]|uniref:BREX-1 system adenine-specific DNA-methyltransferase PglX n=1 Tax=Clostridium botulinum TaxID=1491 RepID=UPI0006A47B12|nr:BREX-1 system adenine-specific DNA-methyltransferase PglX [Clostridium botulinum]KOC50787.1 restriction endonuclease [Clostridium botulinum]
MDKNKIKSFAIWARRNLIAAISDKANRIGIYDNKIEKVMAVQGGFKLESSDEIFKLSKEHRDKLLKEVNEKGFEQVMEEVAYTWFNRFMGLRYMEVNEYLPSGIRILSSEVEGKTEPDVLTRVSEVIDELGLNAEYIYELLDSGRTEDREEAYKHILVKQCNELGKIIPQMFEKISDYTELLLPDNLLEEGSVIRKMAEDIEEVDWKEEVEIIGWMYQYYISEKKDEVFAALKKNVKITKENIPAATQLFTPKWIVKYMVENSLGRLWLEGHPNEELQKEWKYYLEEAEQEPEVEEELKKIREEHAKLTPEDIKILDPCMGSGHILVYAFDVLYEIYKVAGYSERQIPRMILQNNLYGLDIDDRASQLALFALIMKARHYNRRLFREIEKEELELNLCSIQESNEISKEAIDYFCSVHKNTQFKDEALLEVAVDTVSVNNKLREDVEYLVETFNDAKEYGSILEVEKVNFEALKERLKEIEQEDNFTFGDYRKMLLDKLPKMIKQAEIMSRKYEVCVTNPPYLGRKGMTPQLIKYVDENFEQCKKDLFAIFIKVAKRLTKINGIYSMITQQSWMFLSSYSDFRKVIINESSIDSLLHLGANTFEEINGEVVQSCTFSIRNSVLKEYTGIYIKLTEFDTKEKELNYINQNNLIRYCVKSNLFNNITDSIMAYWAGERIFELLKSNEKIKDLTVSASQNITGNNDKYLRFAWEVNESNIGIGQKWIYYAKGGGYRKWYGNLNNIVNWSLEAREIYKTGYASQIIPEQFWYKKGITWSLICTNIPSFRVLPYGSTYDKGGSSIFITDSEKYNVLLGILNSKIGETILKFLNNTLNYQVKDIRNIPYKEVATKSIKINELVDKNIKISKNDWNLSETSLKYKIHPLLKYINKIEQYKLISVFNIWETECEKLFVQLKHNEEELNRIFIDIYGLQDELTPEVEDKDITIRKADRERDIKSLISYAVGCMLGRYSIDSQGLIYAGGNFNDKWNLEDKKVRKIIKDEDGNIIEDNWVNATLLPDSDNVIPITEDEYFEDDIVVRFIDFVRTVYGVETLEENLDFIADSIGRKPSETARQAIRRYFIKDFYKDHLKIYQKRPIYWMFDSGKNNGFKALIYMHRYNEQTVARVRTDYLHTLQRKYEAEMERQQLIVDSGEYTTKDKTVAKKKITKIAKQIEECREYDQIVAHLANEKISIDLDDGVKVNYAKFQGVKIINSKGKEVKMNLLGKI